MTLPAFHHAAVRVTNPPFDVATALIARRTGYDHPWAIRGWSVCSVGCCDLAVGLCTRAPRNYWRRGVDVADNMVRAYACIDVSWQTYDVHHRFAPGRRMRSRACDWRLPIRIGRVLSRGC